MSGGPSPARSARLGDDPQDMLGRVLGFPEQIRAALEAARSGPDLLAGPAPSRLWIVGMGGSAIGGDFVRAWAESRSSLPIDVVRGYDAPHGLDRDSAAVFVSYSGNTEETLAVWDEAGRRGVRRAAITSGGELAARAEEAGAPVLRIPGGSPPRAALGWTSVPLVWALGRAGRVPLESGEIEEAADACRRTIDRAGPGATGPVRVRAWAEAAARGLPVVYAPAARLAPAATRWMGQMNENGKCFAHAAFFPEQNHNEIVGWDAPGDLTARVVAAFLTDDRVHPRVIRRMELVTETIEAAGGTAVRFEPDGSDVLARLYSLSVLGDLASLYAAAARGIDPTPVAGIDRLKAALAAGDERPTN